MYVDYIKKEKQKKYMGYDINENIYIYKINCNNQLVS